MLSSVAELAADPKGCCDGVFVPLGVYWCHQEEGRNRLNIYVYGIMAISFGVDLLLLLGTNRLTGCSGNKKRLMAAALFGALYSGVCMLPDFRFLGNLLWRMVSLALTGSIAYGWDRMAARRCAAFALLSLALGGLAAAMGRSDLKAVPLAAVGLWCLCRLSVCPPTGNRVYIPLEIQHKGRKIKLLALQDTGNTLRDPVTGNPVLVINPEAAYQLTGLTVKQLRSPLETLIKNPVAGLRLIPFRTVGQCSGMMLAMVPESLSVNGRKSSSVVAFAPENFGESGVWQALAGGMAS